jgi:hypothetical protein
VPVMTVDTLCCGWSTSAKSVFPSDKPVDLRRR